MPEHILFHVVFLSQILLLSFYYPRKILTRMRYVFETYPPSTYPRLYPKPIEYYEKARRNYRIINLFILLAGLLILGVLLGYSRSGEWDHVIALWYFLLQFLPVLLLDLSSLKEFKLMRNANSRTTRKAELHPRRLFDFISPTFIGMAIFMYSALILFVLYIYQFQFHWGSKAFIMIILLTAGNLLFAGIIIWNLYGKKINPYQAYKDRIRQIELVVKTLVFMSIAMTMFLAISVVFDKFDSDNLMPTVMSVYFQLLAVISFQTVTPILQIDNTNFEVYKEDPLVT